MYRLSSLARKTLGKVDRILNLNYKIGVGEDIFQHTSFDFQFYPSQNKWTTNMQSPELITPFSTNHQSW
jgi:hypothetical protein